MMIHDPKKQAALIVAGAIPNEEASEEADETVDICKDIISAIKSGSAEDLAFALKAFHSHLGMDEASEENAEQYEE